jgi:hypothetical protein
MTRIPGPPASSSRSAVPSIEPSETTINSISSPEACRDHAPDRSTFATISPPPL